MMVLWRRRTTSKWRFLPAAAALLFVRVAYAGFLYMGLGGPGNFKVPFMTFWKVRMPFDWLYLFSAWDTGHYVSIAESWYSLDRLYLWAFFPLYPSIIKIFTLIGVNIWIAAFIISIVSGTLSIVVFQKVAEAYLPKNESLIATLLYFLFPPVFVFSGVSYTEPLFLLFSLLSWHFHLLGKEVKSALSMALASAVRPNGILITVPVAYDYLRKKKLRDMVYLSFPVFTLLGWAIYGYIVTGDFFILLSVRSYWETESTRRLGIGLSQLFHGEARVFSTLRPFLWGILMGAAFMGFILFLSYRAWRLDKALGLYNFTSILAITYFGVPTSCISFPRLLSFLFPIGLGLNLKKSFFIAAVICFLMLDYIGWLAFLTGTFH